jgi:hypothetical protein
MLDGMGREEMRAADADRHAVADKLRVALGEGRLDLHEYDERLQQAYAAKTYGDLDQLLTDLPNVAPVAVPSPTPAAPARRNDHVTAQWLAYVWSSWLPAVMITSTIWAAASLAAGKLQYFWPIWVAGPWGLVLIWQTIGGLASGQPQKLAEARERKELAKQRKRERKALEDEAIARGEVPPPKPARIRDAKTDEPAGDAETDDATDRAKVRDGRADEASD